MTFFRNLFRNYFVFYELGVIPTSLVAYGTDLVRDNYTKTGILKPIFSVAYGLGWPLTVPITITAVEMGMIR